MAEPKYFVENRFACKRWVQPLSRYQAVQAETEFEQDIARLLAEGHQCFGREEYRLALHKYTEAAWLILTVASPQLPPWPPAIDVVTFPYDLGLFDPMLRGTLEMLRNTPIPIPVDPDPLFDFRIQPPADVAKKLAMFVELGLKDGTLPAAVPALVAQAEPAIEAGRWKDVIGTYTLALEHLGRANNPAARAALRSGVATAQARLKDFDHSLASFQAAIADYRAADDAAGQLVTQQAVVAILEFQGKTQETEPFRKDIARLQKETRATGVGALPRVATGIPRLLPSSATAVARVPIASFAAASAAAAVPLAEPLHATPGGVPAALAAPAPARLARPLSDQVPDRMTLLLGGKAVPFTFGDAQLRTKFVQQLYEARVASTDLAIVDAYAMEPTTFVAYLPHVYFFVLPMAMGDVYAEMGDYAEAIAKYTSTLKYPYLNQSIEAVTVWLKTAQAFLDWGDALFRQAKSSAAQLAEARAKYETLVQNGAPPAGSVLYTGAYFAPLRGRVAAILQNLGNPAALAGENPRVVAAVLSAREAIYKLDHQLNFYGFHADYVPPFTFEYLQVTARYFAQHAVQAERDYVNFKTNAESATFTRQQLQQNVALAAASVELERRRVAEAQAGVAVAQSSLQLTQTQVAVAQANANDFRNARHELVELAELEAWSSAAAVDEDDEVQQTISGYTYYNTSGKDRSDVLADLAAQRTRLTNQLEQNRLDRNVLVAQGYEGVAQAQVAQAQQRVAVAEQGRFIAEMRQRDAADNLSFFTHKEFNEGMWYELASRIRRIARRYLDYGIEIGFLMERAYNVETGRGLNAIRFDYDRNGAAGILAGDYLLRDIDYFTVDRLVSTRRKQSPVKQAFSLADRYPYAFSQLKATGECSFETSMSQFDEAYPGAYLQKIKNVELVIVGEIAPFGVHGTLRNIGVSSYRDAAGVIRNLVYPSDTMLLSLYETRNDMLVFRPSNEELRLFENNGPATMWHLALPRRANDWDLTRLLDVHLVVYYDTFYSSAIETAVRAALPASGSASRGISMRTEFADELYYLAHQGTARLDLTADLFPVNQTNQRKTRIYLRFAGRQPADGANLVLRLNAPGLAAPLALTTNAEGAVFSDPAQPGLPLNQLLNRPLFETWTLTLDPADNPGRVRVVEGQDRVDITNVRDIQLLVDYAFDYPA